ncbi:MAG: hypothetical protein ACHRHE_10745 [Tepidisphaerales bacterium]
MFTLREICLLGLMPGVVGHLVLWLVCRGKRGTTASWPAALAIGGGMPLAGVLASGIHGRPREAFDWLVLLPGCAMATGVLMHWIGVWGMVLVAAGGVLSAWLLAVPGMTTGDAIATAAAPGVVYALLLPAARRQGGATLSASWLIVAAATTCVSMASTGITFGKYTVALSAALGGVWLATLIIRRASLSPGGLAAFVLIWTSLLVYGYEWVDVPRWRVLVLLATPLALWLGEIPGIRSRGPRTRSAVTLACVFAFAAIAAVPAVMELLTMLRSQTQVGGY